MINPRGIAQKSFSQSFDSFHIKSGLLFRKMSHKLIWRTIMIYIPSDLKFLFFQKRLFSSAVTMILAIKNHISFG